jgi:hypothetical protein
MGAIEYQPSMLAPTWFVRQVRDLIPAGIDAVEGSLGERVPDLIVTIGGPAHFATTRLLTSGWRKARFDHAAKFWAYCRNLARCADGMTAPTRSDKVLIGLSSGLAGFPAEVWPTIVHELVHTVQHTRPGRRDDWQTVLDNDLRISALPDGMRHAVDAITAIEEAEAYAVQHALAPVPEASSDWDPAAVHVRLQSAVQHWAATHQQQLNARAAS